MQKNLTKQNIYAKIITVKSVAWDTYRQLQFNYHASKRRFRMKKYIAPEYINEKILVEDIITGSPIWSVEENEEGEKEGSIIVDLGSLLGGK